ncbi:outer membrane biosynthesis protein TonB [Lutibacter sp. Hel_I_33_5]|uniref:energy transducer TonB n=1 Tax=Lutibacter sp. Hel_I_33_5 TaxID=1566289 RepID=UPI00119D83C2|nr:energy transducer TonB [Lutibacter sp. Hel_I_33_5]TVZ55519.1 outer membrane biosynthesis protein TonB [Lutibacter sp. Hel_I_33_5]
MPILETKHKKKSAIITAIILLLLVFGIFNYGMQYLDPPEEYGLAISLGNSSVGSGKEIPNKAIKPSPKKTEEVVEEKVEEIKEVVKEEVVTQDTEEAPVIEKAEEIKKEEPQKVVEEKKVEEKPKPSEETKNALNNLFNGNSDSNNSKGKGDDEVSGNKGVEDGDSKSSKYYGNSGSGDSGNYNLAGRNATSKPIEKPNCQEEGIVVVSIEVDKSGNVIRAIPGVKGSTNTAPCLLAPAKQAALNTKWNADNNAPIKQKGTIIYKFSLSK